MPDHATSSAPAVQAQLDRLWALSPGADVLGLERITRLLDRIGNPHMALPPVFHVAGTNGKGSTCAFLRAGLEAAGKRVHVYSSPHLVRFNERIRLAGRLIEDDALAALLAEVLDRADGIGASFFEVTTAAMFLAFHRTPADACVIEVGLGGRLDATNVLATPAITGIAALGMDHEAFLGSTLEGIAAEKAGIAKPGTPMVTLDYAAPLPSVIDRVVENAGARRIAQRHDWSIEAAGDVLRYRDAGGELMLPRPALPGDYQHDNLGLAIAMLRHQDRIAIPEAALVAAARDARWPARMQKLDRGALVDRLPAATGLWLDGAHNPSAAIPVASAIPAIAPDGERTLVLGMLANKDAGGVLAAFAPVIQRLVAVSVPGHAHHEPDALAAQARSFGIIAQPASNIPEAVDIAARYTPAMVLIAGSLYLAGQALDLNGTPPD